MAPRTSFPWTLRRGPGVLSLRRPHREESAKSALAPGSFFWRFPRAHRDERPSPLPVMLALNRSWVLPSLKAGGAIGAAEPPIFCFRCWCGDRHLLELHQHPCGRAVGSSPIKTTA